MADKLEVFKRLYEQPFGKILLALLVIGLFGYVTWRFMQAIWDMDQKGKDFKGLVTRAGYAASGLMYAGFAVTGASLLLDEFESDEVSSFVKFAADLLLNKPLGRIMVAMVALGISGVALYQVYRGLSGKYQEQVDHSSLSENQALLLKRGAVLGYISRGVILGIIGYFFFRAAIEARATKVKGMEEAFAFLEGSCGGLLLGTVALGFIGYGAYMFVEARYHRMS